MNACRGFDMDIVLESGGCFVTGTDTGVGKTRVAAGLLQLMARQNRRVVGMKPVVSGAEWCGDVPVGQDGESLYAAGKVDAALALRNPYRYEAPLAPHIAAQQAGSGIDIAHIRNAWLQLRAQADCVVVEGAGGWYVPLDAQHSMADLALALALPVVLVVGMRLGCINHAVLTAHAIQATGLPFVGWVANRIDPYMLAPEENLAALRSRLPSPLLAVLPWQEQESAQQLADHLQANQSWL